ncbi:substrate-binding periplasmic protein [Noviherbaspirillum aerium]|uniref:substrate-binding periplasmic protein n=1 Tax=Noviherbaspirillum aerium TaxID=2588497 RepID=UPI00124D6AFA|nr:transporter substrate-binding domain-containing protein [Noviherbaspirillum aerium]
MRRGLRGMSHGLFMALACSALPAGAAGVVGALGASGADAPKVMRLASLEWLPYVGAALDRQGWSGHIVSLASRPEGYQVKIDYFPWTRAVQLGMRDAQYAGYFPAYYTVERARLCHFSLPIGSSTVGFAYLKDTPPSWNALQDLAHLKIGVVAGFSNGPVFDNLVSEGKLTVDASPNDMLNLRKLLAGRVDTVVIDKLVMRYLLLSEPSLARERGRIAFHEKPLAELPLHVCFQRTPEGREMQQAFNRSVRDMSLKKLESDYFQQLERKAPAVQ